ncbi:MAG: tetratricopeptide repeat protein [Pseudomonadota bacterium]
MTPIRIFIASPGDVAPERETVLGLIDAARVEFAPQLELQVTFWEHQPLLATADFQSQIGSPADTDIFIMLLWSRLGSPLGPQYVRADGSRFESATVFEFEQAHAAHAERGAPQIIAYRKEPPPAAELSPTDAAQHAQVDAFFQRWFEHDDATARGAYHRFADAQQLGNAVGLHLRQLLSERVPPPNNLPAALNRFVGREDLLQEVGDGLGQQRLLALVGPGGSGKSRLALEVARRCLPDFPDGVFLVPLAALSNPEGIAAVIADVLGVREGSGQSTLAALSGALVNKHMLLIIDNLEQVQPGARVLVELLQSVPALSLLVTSREALQLGGAINMRVPPLEVPDRSERDPAALQTYDCVQMFTERASAARPDFELTADNAWEVAEICRRVDALPLAIELAAARVSNMDTTRLLSALDKRFKVLSRGGGDLLDHQRNLKELIGWSYDLLDEEEQVLWRRVAIFADGATLSAAQAVCDPDDEYFLEVDLPALADKSLLNIESGSEDPRVTMLASLREYAFELLRASTEYGDMLKQLHAWCVTTFDVDAFEQGGERLEVWLQQVDVEDNNLREILTLHRQDQPAADAFARRLISSLWYYWYDYGVFNEGVGWLRWALEAGPDTADVYVARATRGLTTILRQQNELDAAQEFAERGRELFVALGDALGEAAMLGELGAIALRRGALEEAQDFLDRSIEVGEGLPENQRGMSFVYATRGVVEHLREELPAAVVLYEKALALGSEISDRSTMATAMINLGEIAQQQGDLSRARELYRDSLKLFGALQMKLAIAYCAELLAGMELKANEQPSEAAYLFGAAARLREELNADIESYNAERLAGDQSTTRSALSSEDYELAWQTGYQLGAEGVLRHIATAD